MLAMALLMYQRHKCARKMTQQTWRSCQFYHFPWLWGHTQKSDKKLGRQMYMYEEKVQKRILIIYGNFSLTSLASFIDRSKLQLSVLFNVKGREKAPGTARAIKCLFSRTLMFFETLYHSNICTHPFVSFNDLFSIYVHYVY